jgi:hypothetical protein
MTQSLGLVQCDVQANPGLLLVELDLHDSALAHPHEIVYQRRLAAVRPVLAASALSPAAVFQVALLIVEHRSRRPFSEFEFGAYFLDLRSLLL